MRRAVTWAATAASIALTAHTFVNLRLLRIPPSHPGPPSEYVTVLLPLRDEAHRVAPALRALVTALDYCGDTTTLVVLDDESTDATSAVVRRVVGDDPRVTLVRGSPRPPGWLGKPWACAQLAEHAGTSSVLVFVDADVVLAPHAVAACAEQLRDTGLSLVCPYPRQLAVSPAERLVQPLLQWSWLTTLPLRVAERSPRASLGAANGQLLAVDAATYHRAGGHAAVRGEVLDDLALLRAVKAVGGTGGVTDGTHLATCRMYDGWPTLRAGYAKSLWSAFGSPVGAVSAIGALSVVYVWPFAAMLAGSPVGAIGYTAGVVGRAVVASRTGGRVWPDSLAHPGSILALGWLTASSWRGRRRRTLVWKGRQLG